MRHYKFVLVFLVLINSFLFANAADEKTKLSLPKPEARRQMVLKLKAEIDRIDGEGLTPRFNRLEGWDATLDRLATEAYNAKDLYDLGRVFKRIDATYPNLHAKIYLISGLDEKKDSGNVTLPVKFAPEFIESNND